MQLERRARDREAYAAAGRRKWILVALAVLLTVAACGALLRLLSK